MKSGLSRGSGLRLQPADAERMQSERAKKNLEISDTEEPLSREGRFWEGRKGPARLIHAGPVVSVQGQLLRGSILRCPVLIALILIQVP